MSGKKRKTEEKAPELSVDFSNVIAEAPKKKKKNNVIQDKIEIDENGNKKRTKIKKGKDGEIKMITISKNKQNLSEIIGDGI